MAITLRIHYHYYSASIALLRMSLSLPDAEVSSLRSEEEEALLKACSAIIELTKYMDTATYTPVWSVLCFPYCCST